jgi:pSer/pThr/pTyr-binding forkhead associated (FHA) protein
MELAKLEPLRQACCAAAPLTLECHRRHHEGPQDHALEQPFGILGRSTDVEVVLEDPKISRRHLYLQLIGGRLFFVDLGSRTGVRHEGARRTQGWLDPGQTLRLATWSIRRAPDSNAGGPSDAANSTVLPTESLHAEQPLTPGVTLEMTSCQGRCLRWQMNRVLTLVGTTEACKVRLPGPGVSRFHCSLLHTPLGVWVIDLHSRTGTFLNDQPVRFARLADGDHLRVGSCEFRPWYDEPGTVPAPVRGQLMPASSAAARWAPAALAPALVEQFNLLQEQMLDQFHQTMTMVIQTFGSLQREQTGLLREEIGQLLRLTRELHELQVESAKQPPLAAKTAEPASARMHSMLPNGAAEAWDAMPPPRPCPEGKEPVQPPADASIHAWLSDRIAALTAERQGRWEKFMNLVMGR